MTALAPFTPVLIVEIQLAFEAYVRERHLAVADLSAHTAIGAAADFYRERRVEDVAVEDGDMLLFQWGTYDWGQGRNFEFDITRQLISAGPEEDDEAIWQLSLTLRFPPTPGAQDLGRGDRWCHTQGGLSAWLDFVFTHPATEYATGHDPTTVALTLGTV